MSNLLDQLMAQFEAPQAKVDEVKEDLTPDAPVTFEGVNAPEFDEDPMEAQFEAQQARMRPEPNDGLEDDEIPLTADHAPETTLDEDKPGMFPQVNLENIDPAVLERAEARAIAEYEAQQARMRPEPNDAWKSAIDPLGAFANTPLPEATTSSDVESLDDSVEEVPNELGTKYKTCDEYRAEKIGKYDMSELVAWGDAKPWFLKPWNARFLNLSRRTRNALHNSHLRNISDLRFESPDGLKNLKGFGKKALEEVDEIFSDAVRLGNIPSLAFCGIGTLSCLCHHKGDLTVPAHIELYKSLDEETLQALEEYQRHYNAWTASPAVSHNDCFSQSEEVVESEERSFPMTQEQCDDLMAQNPLPTEQESEVETIEESPEPAPAVEESPIEVAQPAPAVEEPSDDSSVVESETSTQARLKILVVGSSVATHREGLVTQTLEKAYGHHIEGILKQVKVPSLGMVDYGKGWAMLGAAIRDQGWPEGVDVLHVNDCYRGKAEIMMELHPIADLVVMS